MVENEVEKPEEPVFDKATLQANFSALLYLLTEQQDMIGKLLQALLAAGVIESAQLDKITDYTNDGEGVIPTYNNLYNRYAQYYLRTKAVLERGADIDGHYRETPKDSKDE